MSLGFSNFPWSFLALLGYYAYEKPKYSPPNEE